MDIAFVVYLKFVLSFSFCLLIKVFEKTQIKEDMLKFWLITILIIFILLVFAMISYKLLIYIVVIVWLVLIILAVIKDKRINSKLLKDKLVTTENSWDAYILFKRGEKSYEEGSYAEAIELFNNALDKNLLRDNPTYSAEFYDYRGACYQQLSYDVEAAIDYEKSIEHSPDDCNKYFCLSVSYSALKQHDKAIKSLERAIELSKIDNYMNKGYNKTAIEMGYKDLTQSYEIWLFREKSLIEFKTES
jgi:tetratricopeptide (TPR) repeat protein